ncbi:MAG: hypothetical protein ACXWHB_17350 [Usitatibacter sp.]
MTLHTAALSIPVFLLLACAAPSEHGIEQVKTVTAGQKERQCKSLGTFTVEQGGGPDKTGAALAKARTEALRRGGNGVYVIASTVDWESGASVNAEALQCQF